MSKSEVKLIANKKDWENYLRSRTEANFLQSWNWGVFQQDLGKQIFRFGLYSNRKMVGCALAVKEKARRGTYFAITGGPIIDWSNRNNIENLFQPIIDQALREKCDFIRIRPQELNDKNKRRLLRDLKFLPAPMHLTADLTIQVDLKPSEDEILNQMRKNTRYQIRKSKKLKIKVELSKNLKDIREFYKHQMYLAKKHKFIPFSYDFLHQQFRAFVADDQAMLFHAFKDRKLLASAFIIFYNQEAVYHYGISTPQNNKLPGSYACLWEAMVEAKRRGMKRFNLWGVAPRDKPDHRFAGVSLFKRGFGGEEIHYLPTHDLPLSKKYALIHIFEKGRKKIRGL